MEYFRTHYMNPRTGKFLLKDGTLHSVGYACSPSHTITLDKDVPTEPCRKDCEVAEAAYIKHYILSNVEFKLLNSTKLFRWEDVPKLEPREPYQGVPSLQSTRYIPSTRWVKKGGHVILTHDEFFSTDKESTLARDEKLNTLIVDINIILKESRRYIFADYDAHNAGDLYVVFIEMRVEMDRMRVEMDTT